MTRTLIVLLALAAFGCERDPAPQTDEQLAVTDEQPTEPEPSTAAQEAPDAGTDEGAMGPGTEEQQQILVQAKSAFLNEQWDIAEQLFEKLTRTGPVSGPQVTAYIALGDIYNETDRTEQAEQLYTELREKAPDVPEVHFVLARTLAKQGETTKAMKAYEKTITMQPDYLQAMVELAGLYAKAGRKEEAERLFYKYEQKVYKLASALENPQAETEEKLRILEIFSFVDDDRANEAIAKMITDRDPAVRERAIWLAVDLGLGAVRPNLEVLAANDPDRRVRLVAKEALGQLKDAPTEPLAPKVMEGEGGK